MAARDTTSTPPLAMGRGSKRNAASTTAGALRSSVAVDALPPSEHIPWLIVQRARSGQAAPLFIAQQQELPARRNPKPLATPRACRIKMIASARRTAMIVIARRPGSQRRCQHEMAAGAFRTADL